MVPLKYLSNFWRTVEMPLINCEINIFLTWSENFIIVTRDYGNEEDNKPNFEIADKKLYVPVVTLSAHNNEKLLQPLKTGFKKAINWNKYQSEPNYYKMIAIDLSKQQVLDADPKAIQQINFIGNLE